MAKRNSSTKETNKVIDKILKFFLRNGIGGESQINNISCWSRGVWMKENEKERKMQVEEVESGIKRNNKNSNGIW